ncbi:succinylglutamate desuccinylase/aspartoacylase family protein [Nonlabens ulvanivorans]|uniref:succinylglutamate desuccinylase/aspartoacylase family protein n=1 Tax=Nonlabens ulvanivorans TaxID=906888 RepID=UPI00294260E0|nr:succinylglutamate desuccinylase/aspartoacylase family protein [Nonlabens ulvanivorans]WOI22623.1 succinylglutamate desuccinylase/aspartoacylase family protein [Nonlabens ulvanivorans]
MSLRIINILDTEIKPGHSYKLNFNKAKLYTSTAIEVPVIISRARKAGPVVLLTGGLHGDEINGIEVVRQIIAKGYNKPQSGTIICMPVLNIFGFLNMKREFPDGRDLNRSFPGYKSGSLAGRFAHQFVNEILPHVDIVMDFHTGGAQRFNAPQMRVDSNYEKSLELAQIFKAPFLIHSGKLKGTLRHTCMELGKAYLLFEGGKSFESDKNIVRVGVQGAKRVLYHLDMLDVAFELPPDTPASIVVKSSKWLRASYSGLFHPKVPYGRLVEKGEYIATITDPYGSFRHRVKSNQTGYIINVNQSPMVYQGDAIFHITANHGEASTQK